MKYRRLTGEELKSLEKEFIDFLVINSITADEWVKIKRESPSHAEQIIELFSDFILDPVLKSVNYLVFKAEKEIYAYQCLENKIVLVGLKATSDDVNFREKDFIKGETLASHNDLKIFTTEKKYNKQRELELFEMMEKGCEISDGRFFKVLCLAL